MSDEKKDEKRERTRQKPTTPPPSRAPTVQPSPISLRGAALHDSTPRLSAVDFDLSNAARRILEGALALVRGERVVILTDTEHGPLAQAVYDLTVLLDAKGEILVLEDVEPRPWRKLPARVSDAMAMAQASVLFASAHEAEATALGELFALVRALRLRHAHVVGVSRRGLLGGFSADAARILDATRAVRTRLRPDSRLTLKSPGGSDLEVRLDPAHRWIEHVGVIRPGRWEQLPHGAIRTTPGNVTGVFVADASLSDVAEARGVVGRSPVSFDIEAGQCKAVRTSDLGLKRRVEELLRRDHHGDRVGTVVLGTNVGLAHPTGEAACDQNLPGLHLSFGDTFAEQTGATWTSRAHLVATCAAADVDLDGTPLLRAGRYMVS